MFKRRRLFVLIAVACLILASIPLMNVSALSNGKKVYYITDSFDYFNVQSAIGSGSAATVDQCLYIRITAAVAVSWRTTALKTILKKGSGIIGQTDGSIL